MTTKLVSPIVFAVIFGFVFVQSVQAQTTQRFTTTLTGAKEVPANSSAATGTATLEVNTSSTPAQATLFLTFSGLSSAQTAAHFHGPASTTTTAGPFWTIPNGQHSQYSLNLTATQVSQLQNGQVYINVHTQNYPDGEIRGQLQLASSGTPQPTVNPSSSPNATAIPSETMCRADIDQDGVIDISDYSILVAHFFQNNPSVPRTDINQDGVVDISDYSIMVGFFLQFTSGCSSSSPAPTGTATPTPSGHTHVPGESMAMTAWRVGGKNAPNPAYDKCDDGTDVVAAHNQYYVIAYDGIKYPTWHPPVVNNPVTGVGKCYFGHEHGTNPQNYIYWNEIVQHFGKDVDNDGTIEPLVINAQTGAITPGDRAGIPFGIANEHMDQYYNQENRDSIFVRHEDHVGHKIEIVNNESEMVGNSTHVMSQISGTNGINVPYYQTGSNTFQPTGVTCAHLHKFHQGTHSGDAILNNLHEVVFHSKCESVNVNGINAPAYYPNNTVILTGMMSFGKPGIYKEFCGRKRDDNICGLTGANFGTSISSTEAASCQLTDPLLSRLPDAINSNSLGRNMTDKYCLEHVTDPGYGISEGSPYFTPYEIWEGDFAIYTGNTLTDNSMIAEHGRQWDVLDPVRIIDIGYQHPSRTWQKDYQFTSEICDPLLKIPGTNSYRTIGCESGNRAWDSPQASFRGLKRTTYFGRNRISNSGGSQVYWTDPIGGNAVTTEFNSGLKQRISPVEADIQRIQSRVQQLFGSNHFLNDRALQRSFNNGGGTVHAPN